MINQSNEFFSNLYLFIDKEVVLLKGNKNYLSYEQFKSLSNNVRHNFLKLWGCVPKEIEVACKISEAIIAPDKNETIKILKDVGSLVGGLSGIAAMISGVGLALGWGAGVITVVTTYFVGIHTIPVIGQIIGGASLVAIASYFYFHEESPESITTKAVNALKQQIEQVEKDLWAQYGNKTKYIS